MCWCFFIFLKQTELYKNVLNLKLFEFSILKIETLLYQIIFETKQKKMSKINKNKIFRFVQNGPGLKINNNL